MRAIIIHNLRARNAWHEHGTGIALATPCPCRAHAMRSARDPVAIRMRVTSRFPCRAFCDPRSMR
eukprot:4453206-Lingulodinium_polyedra.AAC.1